MREDAKGRTIPGFWTWAGPSRVTGSGGVDPRAGHSPSYIRRFLANKNAAPEHPNPTRHLTTAASLDRPAETATGQNSLPA